MSELPIASVKKRLLRFRSCENVFLQQVHFHADQTHFHMKGFALGLVLKQRQKITWKWPNGLPYLVVFMTPRAVTDLVSNLSSLLQWPKNS